MAGNPFAQALPGKRHRETAPGKAERLVEKDLRYLVQAADARQSAVPLSTAARAQFAAAVTTGLGAQNIAAVAQLYA
jgi:3-hydroxyisobutyrate dehydrogenase-like beta-hydroxyacid dehydrogenase